MLDRNCKFTRSIGDVVITASLPYIFSERHPLELLVDLPEGGSARITGDVLFRDATEADAQALLNKVKVLPCRKCGAQAFDPASVKTNREGLCEQCFHAAIYEECRKDMEKEAKAVARRDQKMLKDGYSHRVTAWIHPTSGGSDRQVDIYVSGEPTKGEIAKMLKRKGSSVVDDYTVTKLEAGNC